MENINLQKSIDLLDKDTEINNTDHSCAIQSITSTMKLSPKQAEKLGEFVVELLSLKFNESGRIDTSGGDKTELGLGRTIERALNEALENDQ